MSLLSLLRSPRLSFIQTLLSLLLSLVSLSSSYWCVGRQKVPKPLCSASRRLKCTPVHGVSDGSFSWETGDDRFIFPSFHAGLWTTCEENIYTDAWGESSRGHSAILLSDSEVFVTKVLRANRSRVVPFEIVLFCGSSGCDAHDASDLLGVFVTLI
ncbi:hypothetical protein M9458_008054, partial [Cirrhinus mrigala]